jgi:two-component sensor histidine kinase
MRWVAATALITVAAFLLSMWMSRSYSIRFIAPGLLASLTYSVCIGGLCTLAGFLVGPYAKDWSGVQKAAVWTAMMAVSVVLGTALAYSILQALGLRLGSFLWALQFAVHVTVTFGAMMVIYEYWRFKYLRAEQLATEARLASLESRIHPHFLFNTLNTISSLIHSDPERADQQLQRLCALLRFSLDAPETRLVPLAHELKIVRDYLEIERTRFGERLRYTIEAEPSLDEAGVPPLAIQTLVENSVKHVIAQRREGGSIAVRAEGRGERLVVSVADCGPGVTEESVVKGHGLAVLRERLQVLFGGAGALRLSANGVEMELPR